LREFLSHGESEAWCIVDVRSGRERGVSLLPEAMSVAQFEAEMAGHGEEHILVYCTAGCRSGIYAQALRKRGLDAYNLWGGVLVWACEGRPFVTPDGKPTQQVAVWGVLGRVLPPGYQAVKARSVDKILGRA
jgi:rhodanese-related sulfurtransferase